MEFVFNDTPVRLDIFLTQKLSYTRSYIKTLVDAGDVLVNGKTVKAGFMLRAGDKISANNKPPKQIDVGAENIPLNIVYEDDCLLVINKQAGLVVHPCNTTKEHTLVNALMYHIKNLSSINGMLRPGIVHRLDKDTGGLMVVAKTDEAHKKLSAQLKDKTLNRQYKALIKGRIKQDFVVEGNLARNPKNRQQMSLQREGRYSKTIFTIDKVFSHYTLLNCQLTTGRTHQIRAHLKHINHPIVGDALYGGQDKTIKTNGQLLFAYKLEFVHPITNKIMTFEVPLPNYFTAILNRLD